MEEGELLKLRGEHEGESERFVKELFLFGLLTSGVCLFTLYSKN